MALADFVNQQLVETFYRQSNGSQRHGAGASVDGGGTAVCGGRL